MTNTYIISAARLAGLSFITFLLFLAVQAVPVSAAESCNFTRDLEVGVDGEDVRCLQKYLNSAGYKIASSGPGSPGGETTLFRDGTKAAVVKWQAANGLSPASGYFGTLSRAKYASLNSGSSFGPNASSSSDKERDALLAKIAALQGGTSKPTTTVTSGTESAAKTALTNAIEDLREAEEQIDDTQDGGGSIGNADDEIVDARDDFYSAVAAYLDGNYQRAQTMAEDASENAIDAFEDAGGETEADETEDYLDELEDDIDAAWVTIEDADDDGEDVEEAENLLEEAEDRLDEAKDALDNDDIDEAENLGEEVEDLIDDAVDAIGEAGDDESDAENAIEDAQDAIDEAEDAIAEAEDDGDDTSDAEDLLDEAQDLLDDAEDAFDDEDYDEAIDLAEDAEDLANDAIDEL